MLTEVLHDMLQILDGAGSIPIEVIMMITGFVQGALALMVHYNII